MKFLKLTDERDHFRYVNVERLTSFFALIDAPLTRLAFSDTENGFLDVKETPKEIMGLLKRNIKLRCTKIRSRLVKKC